MYAHDWQRFFEIIFNLSVNKFSALFLSDAYFNVFNVDSYKRRWESNI